LNVHLKTEQSQLSLTPYVYVMLLKAKMIQTNTTGLRWQTITR